MLAAVACTGLAPDARADTAAPVIRKLLVVVPEAARVQGRSLAGLLADQLNMQVSLLSNDEYAADLDERAHDGFVYLGSHYPSPPQPGFLADMARTTKPLMWIGYHGWLLDEAFQRRKGLRMLDRHVAGFDTVVAGSVERLPPTDTSWVEAPAEAVLYWLYDASRLHTLPGAVRAGNFTFLSYFPSLEATRPDFAAFRAALDATFTRAPAPAAGPAYELRLQAARADRFRTGIHLPIYEAGTTDRAVGYDSERLHAKLARIRATGAEWVTLSRIHFQDGIAAPQMRADARLTPSFPALANIVRDAHASGLLVRLSIVIDLTEGTARGDEWRGTIRPATPERWWRAYRALVLEAAAFAREHEVESLSLGAELSALQREATRWRELVAAVRAEAGYRGLLGYQANFNALDSMAWADDLDYLAIAAYWPLAADRVAAPAELDASWTRIGARLDALQRRHPRVAIEFGEIGYPSQRYAAVLPYSWKSDRGRRQSLQEQLRCYQSLERFIARRPSLAGVHFFASTAEDFDPKSIGYTPFGKPAAEVMSRILRSR